MDQSRRFQPAVYMMANRKGGNPEWRDLFFEIGGQVMDCFAFGSQ